jgi:hypothetical protein
MIADSAVKIKQKKQPTQRKRKDDEKKELKDYKMEVRRGDEKHETERNNIFWCFNLCCPSEIDQQYTLAGLA